MKRAPILKSIAADHERACTYFNGFLPAVGCLVVLLAFLGTSISRASEREVLLNAFQETATAHLNDAFLLLGATADALAADLITKEKAREISLNVQKRVRIIRAKFLAVTGAPLADTDRKLLDLLDRAYACMDHQAWALAQYASEKSQDKARRFEEKRVDCVERVKRIAEFYSTLPPSPELPEPLSTR